MMVVRQGTVVRQSKTENITQGTVLRLILFPLLKK